MSRSKHAYAIELDGRRQTGRATHRIAEARDALAEESQVSGTGGRLNFLHSCHLSLTGPAASDLGMEAIGRLANLDTLDLRGSGVTDAGLRHRPFAAGPSECCSFHKRKLATSVSPSWQRFRHFGTWSFKIRRYGRRLGPPSETASRLPKSSRDASHEGRCRTFEGSDRPLDKRLISTGNSIRLRSAPSWHLPAA